MLKEEESLRVLFELLNNKIFNIINYFGKNSNIQNLSQEIFKYKALLQEMFTFLIFNYSLNLYINSKPLTREIFSFKIKQNEIFPFNISILNNSDVKFNDVRLNILFKPKKRATLKRLKIPEQKNLKDKLE